MDFKRSSPPIKTASGTQNCASVSTLITHLRLIVFVSGLHIVVPARTERLRETGEFHKPAMAGPSQSAMRVTR